MFKRFFRIGKPFVESLLKTNHVVSRWYLLRTLLALAYLKRIYPARSPVRISLGNFVINGTDYDTLSLLIKEKFAEQEYYFSTLQKAPVIIDCGANIGISVLYFKSQYPDAVIHCFEPLSAAYSLLEQNVRENKLTDVYLYKKALALNVSGTTLYFPPGKNIINARIIHPFQNDHSFEEVQSVKLSDFLSSVQNVQLVKLDVEGAEKQIIEDLDQQAVIKHHLVQNYIIEIHSTILHPEDVKYIRNVFESSDYRLRVKILQPGNNKSDLLMTVRE